MKACCYCNIDHDPKTDNLRPYGPGGKLVCIKCATATPEREAQTQAAFASLLEAAEAISPKGIAVIGYNHQNGPDPFDLEDLT